MFEAFQYIYLLLAVIPFSIYGAFSDRVRGGWPNDKFLDFPGDRFASLAIRCWPFAALAAVFLPFLSVQFFVGVILVFGLTCAAASLGHGEQMDLGKSDPSTEKPNEFTKITDALGLGRGFWAEFVGLGLSGVLYTLPVGVVVAIYGTWYIGVLIALSGFLKAVAYLLAQKLSLHAPFGMAHGNDFLGRNPDGGEVLWGLMVPAVPILLAAFA